MNSNWWADALRDAQGDAPARDYSPPAAGTPWWQRPVYQTAAVPVHAAEPQAQHPQDLHPLTALPKPVNLASVRNSSTCPGCGGNDYFKATPNSSPRCFECGYPVQHSTSGLRVSRHDSSIPTKVSLRQESGVGFQPKTIVGHV